MLYELQASLNAHLFDAIVLFARDNKKLLLFVHICMCETQRKHVTVNTKYSIMCMIILVSKWKAIQITI